MKLRRNIYLIGMPGSGKTTIGRILAQWLSASFIDIDDLIVQKTGKTITQLFDEAGEKAFRKIESEILLKHSRGNGQIIATGGGIVTTKANRELMKRTGDIVYLRTRPSVLARRLRGAGDRPLLRTGPLQQRLKQLLSQRAELYEVIGTVIDAESDLITVAQNALWTLGCSSVQISKGRENVRVGVNLFPALADDLEKDFPSTSLVVISHLRIFEKVKPALERWLSPTRSIHPILLHEGESTKDFHKIHKVYQLLRRLQVHRHTPLLAIGGGVIGDVAGFAAATYMRGLPLLQMPTTLLAQIDSSLGGKNGVNFNRTKNLVGTFYFPKRTYLDAAFLTSLSDRELASGIAEAIKVGLIGDPDLLEFLETKRNNILNRELDLLTLLVQRAAKVKLDIVDADRFDEGQRRWLNMGHTIAHAIEGATGFGKLTHGEAVAIGLVTETQIAEMVGITERGTADRIKSLLSLFELPISLPAIRLESVLQRMANDKKRRGGKTVFIVPESPGHPVEFVIDDPLPLIRQLQRRNKS